MSEIPTFRLGRAVRYFAPVAAVAVLAVPSASFAEPGKGNAHGHGKGAEKGVGHAGPDNGKEKGKGNASDGPDRNNGNDKPGKPGKSAKPAKPGKPGKRGKSGASTQGPAGPQGSAAPTNIVATTVPSRASVRCVSRRKIVITIGRKGDIRRSTVRVNGKKVKTRVRGGKVVTTVDLRRLPKGRYTIRYRAVMTDGDVKTGTRRYRTCTPRQRAAEARRRAAARKKAAADRRRS